MKRVAVVALSLLGATAQAGIIVKAGAYQLVHTTQFIDEQTVEFYHLPALVLGFELEDGHRPESGNSVRSLGLEFFHVSYSVAQSTREAQGQLNDSAVMFNGKWIYNLRNKIFPFAGAGIGGSYGEIDLQGFDHKFYDSHLALAVQVSVGAEFTFGRRERYWLYSEVKRYTNSGSAPDSSGTAAFVGFRANLE